MNAATYRATGRGLGMAHTPFLAIYKGFAPSHFYLAAEMLGLLTVSCVAEGSSVT